MDEKSRFGVGKNILFKPHDVRFFDILIEEITEPMILLLLVVGVVYSVWGKLDDAVTIFVVILLLTLSEVFNEYRAKKAVSMLGKVAAPRAKIFKDGKIVEVESEDISPEDVLVLTAGTKIAADSVVLEGLQLQVDESALTGESFPVDKKTGDMIFAGTTVVMGEGKAKVTVIGKETRLGQVAWTAEYIKPPKTKLQLAMKSLSGKLVYVAVFFSVIIPAIGFLRGQDLKTMILTGLSLSFATIPEELPIVITMVLGVGAYTLSKKNFWVKKIKAAETLGNTTVIVTDKTGTITEGKLKVSSVFPKKEKVIIETSMLALPNYVISPFDTVILDRAKELGLSSKGEVLKERDFGRGRQTRSILRKTGSSYEIFTIGAPEEIIHLCKNHESEVKKYLIKEVTVGNRVIGVAHKKLSEKSSKKDFKDLEKDLTFVGLISFNDPARPGVKETVNKLYKAGIRTIMVTGDHPLTAEYIANEVGIGVPSVYMTGSELDKLSDKKLQEIIKTVSIFARTSPEHKYRIVQALQANKEIVAVTGDGINDSLALRAADIGIAMGIRGTDVAKESAEVVLADDNYITIASGVFEGRKFFDNLQKGIKYYLSVKLALVLIFLVPVIFGVQMPLSPIQIIVLELFMDLAASAGFVFEPAENNIFIRKPLKPDQNVVDKVAMTDIGVKGFVLFAGVSFTYFLALKMQVDIKTAQTYAFSAWIFGHILLAFVSRSNWQPVISLGVFQNKLIDVWAVGAIFFLILGVYVPTIGKGLNLGTVSPASLVSIAVLMILLMSCLELKKMLFSQKPT